MAKTASKKKIQYWGTGRRKKAVARVRLIPGGTGAVVINGKTIDEYFGLETLKYIVRQPLAVTDNLSKYDVYVNVFGGRFHRSGRARSVTASRALLSLRNPNSVPSSKRKVSSRGIRE